MAWMDNASSSSAGSLQQTSPQYGLFGGVGSSQANDQFSAQLPLLDQYGNPIPPQYQSEKRRPGWISTASGKYKSWIAQQSASTKKGITISVITVVAVSISCLVFIILRVRKQILDRSYEKQKDAIVARTMKDNGAAPPIASDMPASSYERYIVQTMQDVKDKAMSAASTQRSPESRNADVDYAIGMLNSIANMAHEDLIFQLTAVKVVEMRHRLQSLRVNDTSPQPTIIVNQNASAPPLKSALKSPAAASAAVAPTAAASAAPFAGNTPIHHHQQYQQQSRSAAASTTKTQVVINEQNNTTRSIPPRPVNTPKPPPVFD